MEVLGAISTITAIVDVSQRIIEWMAEYTKKVAHASSEILELSDELGTLNRVLLDVQGRNSAQIFVSLSGFLDRCRQDIERVAQTLHVGKGARKALQSLLWPFRQKEIQELHEKLSRYLQIFKLALAGDQINLTIENRDLIVHGMTISSDIRNVVTRMEPLMLGANANVANLQGIQYNNQRDQLMQWLLKVNYRSSHNSASRKRSLGTGKWFTKSYQFFRWLDDSQSGAKPFLWLSGIVGTGKTVLMSSIINSTTARLGQPKIGTNPEHLSDVGIAFFYFDFNDPAKQSASIMLLAFIHQLVQKLQSIPAIVTNLKRDTPTGELPDIEDLLSCLDHLSRQFKNCFFFVDALDEADPVEDSLKLLVQMTRLLPQSVHLLVMSRDEVEIKQSLSAATFHQITIPRREVDDDIRSYITERFQTDLKERFNSFSPQLQKEVVNCLTQQAQGMFLWARWQLTEICQRKTETEVRNALSSLPKNLNETYRRIVQQIDPENLKWSKRALFWLVSAIVPMNLRTLDDALTLDLESFEVREERLIDRYMILETCRSLITLQDSEIVALAHLSLKQFLLLPEAGAFFLDKGSIQLVAARACFTFMTCGVFNPSTWAEFYGLNRFKNLSKQRDRLSFLRYCCMYAFEHLKQLPQLVFRSSEAILDVFRKQHLRMRLFESFQFLEQSGNYYSSEWKLNTLKKPLSFGPLSGGESAGAPNYGVLEHSWNSSPISRLLAVGANTHARILVDSSLAFLEEDEQMWSGLSFAAAYDDRKILGQMLEILSNTELSSTTYAKPLGSALIASVASRASTSVHTLAHHLYSNSVSTTPDLWFLRGINIILCAVVGDESLLQLFLDIQNSGTELGGSIDDEALQVALVAAASAGHQMCVSKLLSQKVQALINPSPGRYQAIWDAEQSKLFSTSNFLWLSRPMPEEKTSRVLYRNSKDKLADKKNAMTGARLIPEILTILTSFGSDNFSVVPDFERKDDFSSMNKTHADDLFSPFECVIKAALDHCNDLPRKSPHLDQALLWCASVNNRLGLLEKLLEAGADPDCVSTSGWWTALLLAIECGCLESLRLLLTHGADPNVRTDSWPLGVLDATMSEHKKFNKGILDELLSAGADVDYNNHGTRNTVLLRAFSLGRVVVAGPCIDQEDCAEVNMIDAVLHALLEHGADPDIPAVEGPHGSALIAACATGNISLARLLLAYGAKIDLKVNCGNYGSALIASARHGDLELVELLLQQRPNPDSSPLHTVVAEDYDGFQIDELHESLLIAAVMGGKIEVVKCLLEYTNGATVNQVIESNGFGTPLIAAAYGGSVEITDLLLKNGAILDIDTHQKSITYRTAAITAVLESNEGVARLLLTHLSPTSMQNNAALWATAMVACVVKGDRMFIDLLLSAGVPLNVSCETEDSEFSKFAYPLIAAAKTANFAIYNLLVARGAKKDVCNAGRYGDCLTAAAVSGDLDFVTMLLGAGAHPNRLNHGRKYWSPFVAVVLKNKPEIFRALVGKGGKPDVFHDHLPQDFPDSWVQQFHADKEGVFNTLALKRWWADGHLMLRSHSFRDPDTNLELVFGHPLIAAIVSGEEEMVDLFLGHTADINLVAKTGQIRSPLIAAIVTSRREIARKLIKRGANHLQPVRHDKFGSAVIAACHREDSFGGRINIDIFQELGLKLDPLQSVPDCICGSLLISASSTPTSVYTSQTDLLEQLELVRALLEEGCRPQDVVKGSLYGCALIAAASEVRLDLLEEFVRYGIDMKERTDEGIFGYPLLAAVTRQSQMHKSYYYNYEEEENKFKFVQRLLELGADADVSFNNRTPLMLVMEEVRNFDEEIACALLTRGANPDTILPLYAAADAAAAAAPSSTSNNDDEKGHSPKIELCSAISLAAGRGKHDMVNLLLKHGASPELLPAGYTIRKSEAEE